MTTLLISGAVLGIVVVLVVILAYDVNKFVDERERREERP